jgi:hypothetical protein
MTKSRKRALPRVFFHADDMLSEILWTTRIAEREGVERLYQKHLSAKEVEALRKLRDVKTLANSA